MARAPQPCATHGCPNTKPCPAHTPKPWAGKQPHHSRGFPPKVKQAIHQRDRWTCQQCGHHDPTGDTLHADHRTPVSQGGTHTPGNGLTLCHPCHHAKSAREATQARWGHR